MTAASSGCEAFSGPLDRTPPYETDYIEKESQKLGIALPATAAVACSKLAGLGDADKIQTGIEYLRNHDEEVTIIKADRTVANGSWNAVQLE